MIAGWMVYAVLTSIMLGLAALALERVCQMRRYATRWVWIGAMAAPLMLPMIAATPELASEAGAGALAGTGRADLSLTEAKAQGAPGRTLPRIELANQTSSWGGAADLNRMLLFAWIAASASFTIVLAAGWFRLQRRAITWKQRRIAGTEVVIANDVGPAVFGIVRPRIVAPTWLVNADEGTQRATIAHELEHIAARDPQVLAAALVLLVLLPWNAPLWWQWRRLRFAIEVDCDARVLQSGQKAADYGAALLNVAERRADVPLLSAAMHDSGCALERRVRLLFADRDAPAKSVATALLLSTFTLTVAAAQIAPPTQLPAQSSADQGASLAEDRVQRSLGRELVHAALKGDFTTAVALIDAGADVNRVAHGDGTPMIIAARRGDLPLVQLLLQKGALPDLACAGDGNPLIMASAHGHDEIAAVLVERGADVNGVVIGDETPLINAARTGDLKLVEYLVARGADINLAVPADRSSSAEMRSPLSEATKYGRRAVIQYLLSKGAA